MRGRWWWVLLGVVLSLPTLAFADGKVFSRTTAYAKVPIPDQRALIWYSNGVERLVIETSFVGAGTNFAWVVPLPSVPQIEPATTGLFPTLEVIFQPKVIHDVTRWFGLSLLVLAVLFLCSASGTRLRGILVDVLVSGIGAGGCGILVGDRFGGVIIGIFAFVALVDMAWRIRNGNHPLKAGLVAMLVFLMLALFLGGFFLPASKSASIGTISQTSTTRILDRKRVGTYETVTLRSKDAGELLRWLNENGFAAPPGIEAPVQAYVKEGWVFVAAKVHRESGETTATALHPLAFTFKTREPVYPLRLTGVDNDACRIDLFVFGPERAEVPGFTVQRCERPEYPVGDASERRAPGPLRIRHESLRPLVDGAPVATKLTGVLRPEDMKTDARITWTPFRAEGQEVYSWQGAAVKAANWGSGPFLLVFVVFIAVYPPKSRRFWKSSLVALGVCAVIAAGVFVALPKTNITLLQGGLLFHNMAVRLSALAAEDASPSEVRQRVSEFFELNNSGKHNRNPFTGTPYREEDSPGNYQFRSTTNGFELVWFDFDGAPRVAARGNTNATRLERP